MADLEQRVAELEATVQRLLQLLLNRGDITVNDARAVHGLPEFRDLQLLADRGKMSFAEASAMDDLSELRDVQLATGIITEEEHALLTERDADAGT